MSMPTTEQQETEQQELHELELQKALNQWQNRQRVHGHILLFLCLASFISFALFCLDPCPGTTWLLLISLTLMVTAGASMFHAAHAVVQHQQLLELPVSATRSTETRSLPAAAFYAKDTTPATYSFEPTKPWIFPGVQN